MGLLKYFRHKYPMLVSNKNRYKLFFIYHNHPKPCKYWGKNVLIEPGAAPPYGQGGPRTTLT